ncbi:105aa long hypothetical protein [Pyrococcus horikoshii OT3]|uniref:Uncharacterized protein n=1 Tax=Pyrococcus horikoshii (strain ATCC 700860 / DSM 12428 / JCM 9974 / NBRC 100139 / OT-3) TaxID=70601 RepID=O57986_PYRHO|nr:105aa long hypothetical protein [Pyrococcus horikoshii OT3]
MYDPNFPGNVGSSTTVSSSTAILFPSIPAKMLSSCFTASASLACPRASWMKTPANSGSIITCISPEGGDLAESKETAFLETKLAQCSKSIFSTISQPPVPPKDFQ